MKQTVSQTDVLAALLLCALKKEKALSKPQAACPFGPPPLLATGYDLPPQAPAKTLGLYGLQPYQLALMESLFPCPARLKFNQALRDSEACG